MSLDKYIKVRNKTHIIFDFDETIVKLILPWNQAMIRIKSDLNKLDPNILSDYLDNKISYSTLQNKYVEKFGDKALDLILKNNSAFETEDLQGYLKNDEVINFIKNSDNKHFIWSSNSEGIIKKILKQENILNKFKKIITREDVKYLKPSIEGFNLINTNNVSTNNYLFIGDSKNDEEAARELGIDFYLDNFFKTPGKYW